MGRPRWSVEALSASPATISETSAATPKRVVFPNNCSSQMVTKAPTESWVSTVMATRGQCGSSGLTRKKSAFRVSGGKLWGRVMRVEEILSSADGRPGALAFTARSEEHTSELQSLTNLVCRLLLEKKKKKSNKKLELI